MTAMPHPNVMTIQPEFWAFDLLSRTPATTPSPKRIRSAVPTISLPMMCKSLSLLDEPGTRVTLIRQVRQCQTEFTELKPGSTRAGCGSDRGSPHHPVHRAGGGD